MTIVVERRASDRHEPPSDRSGAQLKDWTGPRIRQAELVDLSSNGALIRTDQVPPLHEPIRVLLEIAREIGWLSAVPVRLGEANECGIQFFRPVPLYFLRLPAPDDHSRPMRAIDDAAERDHEPASDDSSTTARSISPA